MAKTISAKSSILVLAGLLKMLNPLWTNAPFLEHVVEEYLICTFKMHEKDCYFCCLLCNFVNNPTPPRVFFMHFKKTN